MDLLTTVMHELAGLLNASLARPTALPGLLVDPERVATVLGQPISDPTRAYLRDNPLRDLIDGQVFEVTQHEDLGVPVRQQREALLDRVLAAVQIQVLLGRAGRHGV